MAKLKWRGGQAQHPTHLSPNERLEVTSGLHVLVLEVVNLVENNQRERRPVSRKRVTRQIVQNVGEQIFITTIESRRKALSELGVRVECPSEGALQTG